MHEELMQFVNDMEFDRLGAFTFSPEDDTPAAEMPDQIDEAIKEARLDRLMRAQQAISLKRNELRLDAVEKVLIESVQYDEATGEPYGIGRSAQEAPDTDGEIRVIGADENDIGEFINVRIAEADIYDLTGVKL